VSLLCILFQFICVKRSKALPGSRFACKCGSSVKVVSTAEAAIVKLEEGIEEEVVPEDPRHGSFGIIGTYQCEMDEIISFDACPSTNTLVTSHKSQLIRLWNLHTHEVTRTIKSFHKIPITHTEINKTESATLKREEDSPLGEDGEIVWGDADELTWATVAGNTVKVWNAGGNQVSKEIRIDGGPSLGFIKWETTYNGKKRLFVADRCIYRIEQESGSNQYAMTQMMSGHFSQVTGLEWGAGNLMIR